MGEQVPPIDQKERIHYKKYVDKYISSWETAYYRYQYAIESSRFGNKIGSAIFGFLLCKNVLIKQLDEYHVDFVEKRRGLEFLLSIIKNDCGIYRRKGELYKSVKKYDEAVRSYVYAIEILRDAGNSGKIMVERKLCQEGISFCKKEMDKSRCSAKCGFNDVKNGEDYESFVANIIQEAGFICNKTIYTGDQGVDIVVCHKKISVAVQCKFYKNKIGNAAVQEVVAGKKVYGCQKACVVSNACYTSSAKELAKVNRVALLHHSDIVEWLKNVLL
jgi:HJR/Mrr/RecB family endonuclease